MDSYPIDTSKNIPEFESDKAKTQFFADGFEACNMFCDSIGTGLGKRAYLNRLFNISVSGQSIGGRWAKNEEVEQKYAHIDEHASPLIMAQIADGIGLHAEDVKQNPRRGRDENDKAYISIVSALRPYQIYRASVEELHSDPDSLVPGYDGTPEELFTHPDVNMAQRAAYFVLLESGDLRPEDVAQSMGMLTLLTQLSGKKSVYANTANKLESIARRVYPSVCELMDSDSSSARAISSVFTEIDITGDEKQEALRALMREGISLDDVVEGSMIRFSAESLRHNQQQADSLQSLAIESVRTMLRREVYDDDPVPTDDQVAELIKFMKRHHVPLPAIENNAVSEVTDAVADELDLPITQLDWEVLPAGELEDTARDIVRDASERSGASRRIDLDRLNILEGIRQLWGEGSSYYSRGTRVGRSMVHGENGEEQADEYIVLVLQEINDKTGEVKYEHAVAESPIAGSNALYVYRQDATDHRHGWRTVMSLPKKQSEAYGAKRMKHVTAAGADLNATMIEKTMVVITADPNHVEGLEFNGIDKDGNIRTRLRKTGGKALTVVNQLPS